MKNLKLLLRAFAFLALVSVSSCTEDVEPIDPYVLNPNITDCPEPTSFSSSDFIENKVVLTWVSEGDLWEVEYGLAGFAHGQGTVLTTAAKTLQIDGLDITAEYDFYVRTNCGDLTSDWVGPISVDDTIIIDPDPDPDPQTGFFKVDFNNQTFNATQIEAYIINGGILIHAVRGTQGENFSLLLNGDHTGTYNSDEDIMDYTASDIAEYQYTNYSLDNPTQNTGEVVITNIDTVNHTISGTFHYVGYWSDFTVEPPPASIGFTNGSFTVPYQTSIPSTDVFLANVDGNAFNANLIATAEIEVGGDAWNSVSAQNANNESMNVNYKQGITAGTYTITGNIATDVVQGFYSNSDDESFSATSGSVTISSITATNITGTFNFTVFNATLGTHQISSGSFNVSL